MTLRFTSRSTRTFRWKVCRRSFNGGKTRRSVDVHVLVRRSMRFGDTVVETLMLYDIAPGDNCAIQPGLVQRRLYERVRGTYLSPRIYLELIAKVTFILASALSTLSTRVVFAELLTPSAPVVGVAADTQSDPNASNDAARSSQPSASTVTLAPDQAIPLSAADQHFLQMAAMRNLTNAEAGKLAISNSNDIGIKALGQRMIDNPMNLSDQLTSLASKKHTRLPTVPDSRQQAMLASLGNKKGRAFDRAFTVNMKTARIEALRLYTLGAKSRDFDVASFSTMILQALRSQQQNRVAIR